MSRYDSRSADPGSYRDRRGDSGFGHKRENESSYRSSISTKRDYDGGAEAAPRKSELDGLTPFEKNFYVETPSIAAMTESDVEEYRRRREITVDGKDVPKPVKSFHDVGFPAGDKSPMAAALPIFSISSAIRASSVDTEQRLPYNRQRTYPKKPEALTVAAPAPALAKKAAKISISDLLKRNISKTATKDESSESFLGYETWVPKPPKAEKPRSTFNPASLAYLGDCIYELYARRHFLFPPLNIEDYNDRVMAVVRCEAQDAMLQKLTSDNFLTQEERDVLRWGKNIGSSKTRTKKRAGVAVYNRASSLETLVGFLYLTNVQRLDEIMKKIGFSTDTSTQLEQGKESVNYTDLPKE